MRRPLWIANSALLFLCCAAIGVIFFSPSAPPEREDIEPVAHMQPVRSQVAEVNIQQIYENDLFGTYHKKAPPAELSEEVPALPQPPAPAQPEIPVWPKPQFLEPLSIALKGIVVINGDPLLNSAIIADRKTNKEMAYRVGDIIEDAQILKIFSNKVILLRINGQQEVVYLREKDAKLDPVYARLQSWQEVVWPVGRYEYVVDMQEFAQRMSNLVQFVDLLDLTTVYKQGTSIGCRIGRVADGSLGAALGLRTKDIILSINDVAVNDTPSRFQAYKAVLATPPGGMIKARVLRGEIVLELLYRLDERKKSEQTNSNTETEGTAKKQVTDQQITTLKRHHNFAPTLQEIRKQDRLNMLKRGQARSAHGITQVDGTDK